MSGIAGPPPPWVDTAWWVVYGLRLRAAELDREEWIDALAMAWGLVRDPAALDADELDAQTHMVNRKLGREFYPTRPYGPQCG